MRQTTIQAASVLVAVLVAGPAVAGKYGVVNGVNFDAVPWETFCADVQSVPVTRGGGRCEVSHPASPYHGQFKDFSGRGKNPPPTCDIAAKEYQRWTTASGGAHDPWRPCRVAWGRTLQARAQEPKRFSESFSAWRARWFGRWIVGD